MVGKRRNELHVIRDILREISQSHSHSITRLKDHTNLNHSLMQKYLRFLEEGGFIELERHNQRIRYFQITEEGKNLLQEINRVFDLLGFDSETRR